MFQSPLQFGSNIQSNAVSQQALNSNNGYTSIYGNQANNQLMPTSLQGFNPVSGSGPTSFLDGILGQNGAQNAQLGLGALQTLGGLWNSYNSSKLAKKSLGLQTRAFETNLANNKKTYNTALEDRIRSRYATEGRSDQADSYIDKNSL